MSGNAVNVNTGGGSLNNLGGAIGIGNIVSGNTFNVSDSLNVSTAPSRNEMISALQQLKAELDKAEDLPPDETEDLKTNLDAAVKAIDRPEPNKTRLVDKLTTMQKILDSLKNSFTSAIALGKLVSQVTLAANGLL
jgi:hypothetical protein